MAIDFLQQFGNQAFTVGQQVTNFYLLYLMDYGALRNKVAILMLNLFTQK